jgi:hypothetical protein
MKHTIALLLLTGCQLSTQGLHAGAGTTPSTTPATSAPDREAYIPDHEAPAAPDPDAPFVGSPYSVDDDAISHERESCDGAHDHCIPKGLVFVRWRDVAGDDELVFARPEGDHFHLFGGGQSAGPAVRTAPATSHNVAPGVQVACHDRGLSVPSSEESTVEGTWTVATVDSVETEQHTMTVHPGGSVVIAACRVIL